MYLLTVISCGIDHKLQNVILTIENTVSAQKIYLMYV